MELPARRTVPLSARFARLGQVLSARAKEKAQDGFRTYGNANANPTGSSRVLRAELGSCSSERSLCVRLEFRFQQTRTLRVRFEFSCGEHRRRSGRSVTWSFACAKLGKILANASASRSSRVLQAELGLDWCVPHYPDIETQREVAPSALLRPGGFVEPWELNTNPAGS